MNPTLGYFAGNQEAEPACAGDDSDMFQKHVAEFLPETLNPTP